MQKLKGRPPTLDLTPETKDRVWRMIKDGMTQRAIADKIGCSQPTISFLISNRIKRVETQTNT